MGARRTPLNTTLRIGIALAAGFVVSGAAPHTGSRGVNPSSTCHSRVDCGPNVIGGLQITFTGWSCTSGFVARDTKRGTLVLLTAGHCLTGSGLSALWSHHGVAIGRASVDAFRQDSNADAGEIGLTDSRPTNEVYGSSKTDIRSVTGWASDAKQKVGSKVCRSGGASGWRCGSIVVADIDAKLDGNVIHHMWGIDFPSAAGDSGSPVLDQDGRAAGVLIATTPTESLYSTVDWIAIELNARPCVTPSCD
jgi:hypothetical protein